MCRPDAAAASADARLAVLRAEVAQVADSLAGIDAGALSEGSLGHALSDLMRVRRQLDGTLGAIAERFRHSSEWTADGARDAAAWLRAQSVEGFGAARDVLDTGADMAAFPEMGEALRRGEIGARHLRSLREVVRRFPRLRGHLQGAESLVVDLARESEPAPFSRALEGICHRLDPVAAQEDARDRQREFFFRASTLLDGHVRVDGMLPAEVGSLLIAALESARRSVADDSAPEAQDLDLAASGVTAASTGVDVFGTPIAVIDPVDARWLGQRNVEALQRILVTATAPEGGLASVAGQRPQVNVTVSIETLAAKPGEGVDCGWLEKFGVPAQPICADTVRRLACDSSLRPLMIDAKGELVAFGSSARVAPPALRSFVLRRDRHCRFAGCRARVDEVHHVVFFARGGPTTSSNMLGLCWFHHHLVHEGGWELSGDANCDIKGTGPDGRVWTTGPPGSG